MGWNLKQLWTADIRSTPGEFEPPVGGRPTNQPALPGEGASEALLVSGSPTESTPAKQIRAWRRRTLLRKGARLNAAMTDSGDLGSLAILDPSGTVVSWYGRDDGDDLRNDKVVGGHVAQFYVPEDIALGLPQVDLSHAKLNRNSTQAGWRRRADGSVFWAMTFIEAVNHRNGVLQGFSHVIRRSSGPWGSVYGGKTKSLAAVR